MKVYTVGNRVYFAARPSIDLPSTDSSLFLRFDSQKPYPYLENKPVAPVNETEGVELTRMARELRAALGLSLFGFDVIEAEIDSKYYVVDVNYFPSFKELKNDLPHVLGEYFLSLARPDV